MSCPDKRERLPEHDDGADRAECLLLRPVNLSCPVHSCCQSFELSEDGVDFCDPDEGCGGLAVVLNESFHSPDEPGDIIERSALDGALTDEDEPALDLIEPRGRCRREVEMAARMLASREV